MAIYKQGDMVRLKSDYLVEGAIIGVIEGGQEIRYQVFTGSLGIQTRCTEYLTPMFSNSFIINMTNLRISPRLCIPFFSFDWILSSLKTTSRVQCRQFSICQCLRTTIANSSAIGLMLHITRNIRGRYNKQRN